MFALVAGVPLSIKSLIVAFPFGILVALFGGAFGLIVMADINEQKSAIQIFPFLLFPQF